MLLLLSSLSLQAAALQARSQVQAGQRLRQVEDGLMSAAQHLVAEPQAIEQLAARVGEQGQVGEVAYRLVHFEAPSWEGQPVAGAQQQGRAGATLELLPGAKQPSAMRAAFAWELARAQPEGPVQVLAVRELGLRGGATAQVSP
ncbi:MAG: hypothetical protein WD136_00205 [Cyanobium sp.]